MLAVVVAVFAASWLPYRLFVVYNSFAPVRFVSPWFLTFCRLAIYFNSTVNPILYNLMSAKFRKAFSQLFLCSRKRFLIYAFAIKRLAWFCLPLRNVLSRIDWFSYLDYLFEKSLLRLLFVFTIHIWVLKRHFCLIKK